MRHCGLHNFIVCLFSHVCAPLSCGDTPYAFHIILSFKAPLIGYRWKWYAVGGLDSGFYRISIRTYAIQHFKLNCFSLHIFIFIFCFHRFVCLFQTSMIHASNCVSRALSIKECHINLINCIRYFIHR